MSQEPFATETQAALEQFLIEPGGKIHIIMLSIRPGVSTLARLVEYYWYPPGTPENNLYELRIIPWSDFYWWIMSVPARRLPAINNVANSLRLKIKAGNPMILVPDDTPGAVKIQIVKGQPPISALVFPGGKLPNNKPNLSLYTAENFKTGGDAMKFNSPEADIISQREETLLPIIQHKRRKLSPKEAADFIYDGVPVPE